MVKNNHDSTKLSDRPNNTMTNKSMDGEQPRFDLGDSGSIDESSFINGCVLLEPKILASLLKQGLDKILLIDSRSFLEYNTSHIQQSVNVCCSKLVRRRLQLDKVDVSELLTQICHIDVEEYDDVIVYDQCTEIPDLQTEDNFLSILLHKLVMCTTFNSTALLKGGYLAFHAMHPTLCENKASNSYKCTPLTSLSQPCMPVSNIGPTRILPFLYLGSHRDAMSQEIIQVNDISYILNVSMNCPKPPFVKEGHFHRIPVNDNYSAKLLPFFQQAFQFIDKVREANGCVMVHCLAGISRSPTLAIAYVMKYLHMTSDDAYRYVKDKRPTISPNFNFLGQLLEYEKSLKQREEQLQNRQDSNGSIRDGKSAPIIMDLQMCSPSSPIAKVGKPFAFDSHWFSRPTEIDLKSDTNDYLHSVADSVSSEKTTYAEKHASMDIELVQEKCSHTTACQFSPVSDNIPMTPSAEMPPFPFECSIMQNPNENEKQDLNVRKDYRRKSPTISPKSPVNRSFTLSLTPVSLQSNVLHATSEQKRSLGSPISESSDMIFPSSKSPGKGFIKQFSVPLSPVMSPATPGESSEETQQLLRSKEKSSHSTPVLSTQEKDGKTKKVSRAFTLTLSSTNAPECCGGESIQKKFKQEKNFTLPVSPLQQKNVMEVQSEFKSPTFKLRPFTLPISPVISSDRNTSTLDIILPSSTEAATVTRSMSSIPLSIVKPQGSKVLLDLPTSSQEEVTPLLLSPSLKSECENSSGKTNSDKSTIQMDVNLSDPCSKPINTEKMISECTPLSIGSPEPPVTSLSLQSFTSHSSSAGTSFFPGSSNSKLKVHTSQNTYSPSAALAELHFSQAISDNNVLAKPSSLQNFPSTSLDKLNFTPCFAKENKNKDTECSIGTSSSDEVHQEQTLTVSSVCNSMCSSTVTSLSGNQVRLRTHDNRAKRPLARPNSIAFSKYPTFDLGSDCQESSSSGSSASQDDSSETYLLQNRKRSKASHSDEKYSTGKYSERNMYQQITTALECNAMFRTQVYEASRKARSLDDILASGECESLKSQYSPFGKMVQRFGLGSERFTSPLLYDSMTCHNSTDTYQSNSSISSNGSLHGSLEVIQPNFHFLNGINRKGRLKWFNSQRQEP